MASSSYKKIQILPQAVVDRIAAGEVVQRPCNAVKELLENSLDAGSTEIGVVVEIQQGSILERLSVMDNGCGISKEDLALAATRHATSKLQTCQDFLTLATFGFRGEALASISHVARLTLTTRTSDSNVGYQQRYASGEPVKINNTINNDAAPPKPCARKLGTTVLVEDLFYNLPNRKATLRRPNDEYHRILLVAQHYAIHSASKGVGIVCEKAIIGSNSSSTKKSTVYLNTSSLPSVQQMRGLLLDSSTASSSSSLSSTDVSTEKQKKSQQATLDAIVHTYGSALQPHLEYFTCSLVDNNTIDHSSSNEAKEVEASSSSTNIIYSCMGFLTTPSHSSSTSSKQQQQRTDLVLFVNDRLVECPPLKRALEEAYNNRCRTSSSSSATNIKPFAYLSIQVPPTQVDVNVHPTKQQVTLLHLDRICQHLQTQVRDFLSQQGQTFDKTNTNNNANESKKKQPPSNTTSSSSTKLISNPYNKRKAPPESSSSTDAAEACTLQLQQQQQQPGKKPKTTKKPTMVRTDPSSQSGAIEPFLVVSSTQRQLSQQQNKSSSSSSSQTETSNTNSQQSSSSLSLSQQQKQQQNKDDLDDSASQLRGQHKFQHNPTCPLATTSSLAVPVDMTQPGAFAQVAALCTCRLQQQQSQQVVEVRLVRQALPRPKRITPTACQYKSIAQLRRRIHRHADASASTAKKKKHDTPTKENSNEQEDSQVGLLQKKLRQAVFVGVLSRHRSLIQCGEELVEINHYELGKHLFYQLALWRFGGADMARLPHGIDIELVVGSAVQFEERLNDNNKNVAEKDPLCCNDDVNEEQLVISDTNRLLAQQVATCLLQHAEMLADYFSISIEHTTTSNESESGDKKILLTGLPVLLDGHVPSAAGLPLFLLRLATEVDWTEEKPCFHGICRELGAFYAMTNEVDNAGDNGDTVGSNSKDSLLHHQVRHSLFPAVSTLLMPSQDLQNEDSSFRVLTTLSKLYRVFERC